MKFLKTLKLGIPPFSTLMIPSQQLLPPQVWAKTRGGIIVSPAYTCKECVKYNSGAPAARRAAKRSPILIMQEKDKGTHELIFSWLSWLAVLLVGAYTRRRRRRSCPTWRPYSKKETYSLSLPCTSLILDIPAVIN